MRSNNCQSLYREKTSVLFCFEAEELESLRAKRYIIHQTERLELFLIWTVFVRMSQKVFVRNPFCNDIRNLKSRSEIGHKHYTDYTKFLQIKLNVYNL